jgi:isopenicillin N synthase-like dioxygenase
MSDLIETVSFDLWDKDPEQFARRLGQNHKSTGFCAISDHPIEKELVDSCVAMFADFFGQSEELKMKYFDEDMGGARGYTPYKIETPQGGQHADLKEFWQMGRDLPENHPYKEFMFDNLYVSEIPEFKDRMEELFKAYDLFGKQLMQAIAIYLGLDQYYFDSAIENGNSILRVIHYPPVESEEPGERSGAHKDINLFTLLIGGSAPGLEILLNGQWIPVQIERDVLLCNAQEMLERFTNNRIPALIHRVTKGPTKKTDSPRYAIPFFVHPNPDWLIETLPSCIDADHPDLYPESILTDDFLQQRLYEIKLL